MKQACAYVLLAGVYTPAHSVICAAYKLCPHTSLSQHPKTLPEGAISSCRTGKRCWLEYCLNPQSQVSRYSHPYMHAFMHSLYEPAHTIHLWSSTTRMRCVFYGRSGQERSISAISTACGVRE